MNTYFITVQFDSRQQSKYVATESDIDMGCVVDADPENFGFQTREEAEQVKNLDDILMTTACDIICYFKEENISYSLQ